VSLYACLKNCATKQRNKANLDFSYRLCYYSGAMKANTNTTKKSAKQLAMEQAAVLQTERDFKDALLMVSVTVNLFVFCLWVALQVTTRYDSALTLLFFNR